MNSRIHAWDTLCYLLFSEDEPPPDRMLKHLRIKPTQTELIGLANAYFSTAPLWAALCRKSLKDELVGEFREYLLAFHALNVERNARIRGQCLECIDALNNANVMPMPLKGAAYLLSDIYADPGERFLQDIDLLVPASRIRQADSALVEIGFRPAEAPFDYSQHHHLPPYVRSLDDVAVELHTAPVSSAAQASLSSEEIWADAVTISLGRCCWKAATATNMAMLSFLHSEVADRDLARCIVNLRGFLDLRRLAQRGGADINWQRNLERAARGGVLSDYRRYIYVFAQLTGQHGVKFGNTRWRDRVFFNVCKSAIRWPTIQSWAKAFQRLSRRRLMKRYSIGENLITLNVYRIRALLEMIRNRVFGAR